MKQYKYTVWKKDGHFIDVFACSRMKAVEIVVNTKDVKDSEISHVGRAVYGARSFKYPFKISHPKEVR